MSDPMNKVISGSHPQAPRGDVLCDGKELNRHSGKPDANSYDGPNRCSTSDAGAEHKQRDEIK